MASPEQYAFETPTPTGEQQQPFSLLPGEFQWQDPSATAVPDTTAQTGVTVPMEQTGQPYTDPTGQTYTDQTGQMYTDQTGQTYTDQTGMPVDPMAGVYVDQATGQYVDANGQVIPMDQSGTYVPDTGTTNGGLPAMPADLYPTDQSGGQVMVDQYGNPITQPVPQWGAENPYSGGGIAPGALPQPGDGSVVIDPNAGIDPATGLPIQGQGGQPANPEAPALPGDPAAGNSAGNDGKSAGSDSGLDAGWLGERALSLGATGVAAHAFIPNLQTFLAEGKSVPTLSSLRSIPKNEWMAAAKTDVGKSMTGAWLGNTLLDATLLSDRETSWKTLAVDVATPLVIGRFFPGAGVAKTIGASMVVHAAEKVLFEDKKD